MAKAAYLYGKEEIRVEEMPALVPGKGEVLLEVSAVSICGSDLHAFLFGDIGGVAPEGPLALGHEAAGRIIAVGADVDPSMRVGMRVAVEPATPCLQCERCMDGQHHLCTALKFIGLWPYQGAMRQQMLHEARSCIPLPDTISDVGGALLEPLGIALHASRLAKIEIGEDVLVIGCGGIGLLIMKLARLAGARHIFAVDRQSHRLSLAGEWGADHVIDASKVDPVAEIMRLTNNRGVDIAIEAAWVRDTAGQCMDAARYGGRVIIVGIPVEDNIQFGASAARRKELAIQLSRRMKHTYPAAIALAESPNLQLEKLATHFFSLDEAQDAFELASSYGDGVVRAVVLPNGKK